MASSDVKNRPVGARLAARGMDVLIWGAVAYCLLRLWWLLTGIPLWDALMESDVTIPPTALPQIAQFDLVLNEGEVTRPEVTILPLGLRILGGSSLVLFTVMFALVLRAARLLAVRVMHGDPFTAEIPRRLRLCTLWVLGLAAARFAVDLVTNRMLWGWLPDVETFHSFGLSLETPAISFSLVIAAVVCWVLATAFEQGAQLKRDTDGLV